MNLKAKSINRHVEKIIECMKMGPFSGHDIIAIRRSFSELIDFCDKRLDDIRSRYHQQKDLDGKEADKNQPDTSAES